MYQHQSQTYVSLLKPYRDITHYGYPHYYAYASPYFLNNRSKREIRRRNKQTVGYYYGPNGYYGSPWWSGFGRWGYYSKPNEYPYSYTSPFSFQS
eukprot:02280.XXX_14477_14818_1 [CDS] Oithona nana genome sequencing.